ncbi:hypothetical protein [Clostridium lundense]|uniref:hypothetical protein n=1 Tax=Clostridium lundense TaxID=319475 RepID=UPI000557E276|nr:hypothetical protein [Clostridium lundense]
MQAVINFIWEWRYVIIYIISFILFIVSQGKQWFNAKAYSLMLLAKSKAKDGVLASGQEQEDWTVDQLYIILNRLKIPFVTKDALRPVVRKLYRLAKDYIDDGKLNNSIQ